ASRAENGINLGEKKFSHMRKGKGGEVPPGTHREIRRGILRSVAEWGVPPWYKVPRRYLRQPTVSVAAWGVPPYTTAEIVSEVRGGEAPGNFSAAGENFENYVIKTMFSL